MSPSLISDLDIRRDAIFTREHAFVWASAGTGKTHTLTLRALYLLLDAVDYGLYSVTDHSQRHRIAQKVIQSVVLTTFTRKAAAEMHERLYFYLDTVARATEFEDLESSDLGQRDPIFLEIVDRVLARISNRSFGQLKNGCQALAQCSSELQISTIHSLAASILRRHPLEAGIHPGTRFAKEDEEDVGALTTELVDLWWQREAFRNSAYEQDLSTILQLLPVSELREWLILVCQSPWLPSELRKIPVNGESQGTLDCLDSLAGALQNVKTRKASQILAQMETLLERVRQEEDGAVTELTRLLFLHREYLFLKGKNTPKTIAHAISSLPVMEQERLETYLPTYSVCLQAAINREHFETWKTWLRFLDRFTKWIQTEGIRELGVVTFDDMINKAVTLLREHEGVRRSEFNRLRAFLVDEFQDTDPSQLELIAGLLRRPPESRKDVLGFFVGDTKQSIYRFRGVEVGSVLRFFNSYETLVEPLLKKREFHLQTNFRSCSSVTSFSNHFFGRQFNLVADSDLLFPYRDEPGMPTRWLRLIIPKEKDAISAEELRRLAAEATASIIEELVGGEEQDARYKDILLLTRTNRELDTLLQVLQGAGIPVAASGAMTYYQNHEVLDLLNLLIALYHPLDSIAVAAVLRSPLVDVTDDQIHRLLGKIPPAQFFHSDTPLPDFIPASSCQKIGEVRKLVSMRRESSFDEWIQQVRAQIPAEIYTRPFDREGRSIERINRLLKRFREAAQNGDTPPLVWLINQRSRVSSVDRWDEDCGEDVNLFDEGVDAVRAMTIHKAKGLEAPIVIIPSWTSLLEASFDPRNVTSCPILSLRDSKGSDMRAYSLQWGPLRIVSDNYLEALALESRNGTAESMRLSYVSVTRACDQLILLQTPSKRLDTTLQQGIESNSNIEFEEFSAGGIEKRKQPIPKFDLDSESQRLLWEKRSQKFEPFKPLLQHPSDSVVESEPVPLKEDSSSSSMATGQLVHRYLEESLVAGFNRDILKAIWRETEAEDPSLDSLQQAERILSGFFNGSATDSRGQSLFGRVKRGRVLGQEVSVFLTIDKQAWSGVIDLIMVEQDTVYAIDFKTGSSSQPLQDTYAQQEMVYREAVRRLFPSQEVRFEFWWLGSGDL